MVIDLTVLLLLCLTGIFAGATKINLPSPETSDVFLSLLAILTALSL